MSEKQEAIERLNGVELDGGSHQMLSAICRAILPHGDAWTLGRCAELRDKLVDLLGETYVPAAPSGKRITGELRELKDACGVISIYKDHLLAIADRIDAAHDKAIQREHESAYKAGYDEGFASADDWLAEHEDAMAEHGWYRALDADKEPIHLSDEVYQVEGGWVYTVESITFYPDNTTVTCSCKHGFGCDSAHNVRHYHAPTVEDTLREMQVELDEVTALYVAETIEADEREREYERIIAEYAAKLRLAG